MQYPMDWIPRDSSGAKKDRLSKNRNYAAAGTKFLEFKVSLDDVGDLDGKYIDARVRMLDKDPDGLLSYPFSDVTEHLVRLDF